jgi:hypothetical protein
MSHYNGTFAFTKYKQWQGSKKTIYLNQKLPLVLLKAKIILNMQVTIVGNSMLVYFLLLTSVTALAFPKFMGMLVDCVNKRQ